MANVLQYVDWDGLVYYDGKIKDYIEQKEAVNIKFGGEYLFETLPAPSIENVNYVYRVVDTFSTNQKDEWFVNSDNIVYNAGTLIHCVSDSNGVYKYDDFVASGGTLEVDLSNYATKDSIPTKVSELDNDRGYLSSIPNNYITEEILNNKGFITDISGKVDKTSYETDKQNFALKSDIPDVSKFITSIPEEYVTSNELTAEGFLKEHQDLSAYALKSDIPTNFLVKNDLNDYATETYVDSKVSGIKIPTKVSDLQNDLQYATNGDVEANTNLINTLSSNLTSLTNLHNSQFNTLNSNYTNLNDKVNNIEDDLDSKLTLTQAEDKFLPKGELTSINDRIATVQGSIPTVPTKVSAFDNDVNFATENYVTQSINNIKLPDVSKFITEIPDEYVTDSELNSKGYITEHQDLSHKANNILFTEDYLVNNAMGSFVVGDNVKGMSIKDILIKLLDLRTVITNPVEQIKESQAPVYQLNADGTVTEVEYKLLEMTTETENTPPTSSGFYQITDENGELVESGYQVMTVQNDSCFYKVLLPDYVDLSSKGRVDYYDELNNDHWFTCYTPGSADNEIRVIDDLNIIRELYGDEYYLPLVDEENSVPGYNMWIIDPDNTATGKTYRIVIE